MTAQLMRIRGNPPQAVVCWGTNPGPAIVAKNMQTLGMKLPLIMSHGIANQKFIELAGPAREGVVFPAGKLLVAETHPEQRSAEEGAARLCSRVSRKNTGVKPTPSAAMPMTRSCWSARPSDKVGPDRGEDPRGTGEDEELRRHLRRLQLQQTTITVCERRLRDGEDRERRLEGHEIRLTVLC